VKRNKIASPDWRAGSAIPPTVVADFQIGDDRSSVETSTTTTGRVGGVPSPRGLLLAGRCGVRAPRPQIGRPQIIERFRPFPCWRFALVFALALVGVTGLPAAELHVRGMNWFANRKAEQRLKLLLGEQQHGPTMDAGALEDAALVLLSALNDEGYLEPGLKVEVTQSDGRPAQFPLDARLEHPLPRPLAATTATLRVARGRRFSLQEVTFSGLLTMKETEARAYFLGEVMLIPQASERIYSPANRDSPRPR